MNTTVYLFGKFNWGYSQYPHDYAENIFKTFYSNAKSTTQIIIHREEHLMYYGYIRKLEQDRYIGLCVVLNGIYLTSIDALFSLFEKTVSNLITNGWLLHFNERGEIVSSVEKLYLNKLEIDFIAEILCAGFNHLTKSMDNLPAVDYGMSKDSVAYYEINSNKKEIIESSVKKGFTVVLKSEDSDTANLNSYRNVLKSISTERDGLKKEVAKLKMQQRNTKWVSILGIAVVVLGTVLWNKVLFPSEVTRYDAGEFTYYGPMKNKMPHGVGVAIYPANDEEGRKYYIGNFNEGERQDSTAILFYNDGDYFHGVMEGDEWKDGLFYRRTDGTYFEGSFKNNEPFNGEWYDHERKYLLDNGVRKY